MYEVELKFRVQQLAQVVDRMQELGAVFSGCTDQVDEYFAHPVRDFAETDEAFRIRSIGEENRITYKGPLADPIAKTRRELEMPIASGREQRDVFREILLSLGFSPVRRVAKQRSLYRFSNDGRDFELTADQVVGLGEFVEVETIATEEERGIARDAVCELADRLGLHDPIRKSYLAMLIEQER